MQLHSKMHILAQVQQNVLEGPKESIKAANDPYVFIINYGEGPYQGLLLLENGYYRFHI